MGRVFRDDRGRPLFEDANVVLEDTLELAVGDVGVARVYPKQWTDGSTSARVIA
jgi:hypothetical protein